jgi:hypothetical protein
VIDFGSVYEIAVDVRDASGTLTAPATATLTITLPDGTTVSPVVPLPSSTAGQLRVDYVPPQVGRYTWRMVTTGPVTAYADVFDVSAAALPGVVSLARAKKQLNMAAADTSDDDELRGFIGATTGVVEREVGQIVARRSFTERRLVPCATSQLMLGRVPAIALTSVIRIDVAQTWSVSSSVLDLDPDTGLITVLSGALLQGYLRVTYDAGMAVVPEEYQLGALIILQHLWETQRGTMGVQLGGDGETFMPGRGYAIPHRASELLGLSLPGIA